MAARDGRPEDIARESSSSGLVRLVTPGWRFKVLSLILGLSISLGLLEAGLRVFVPPSRQFYVWPPGTKAMFRPSSVTVPGITGPSRFTINSVGIRGREFNQNHQQEYRVLTIGGSTTECLYLDDSETWPFVVQELLGKTADGRDVWVGNVGKSGANSRDHVQQVKYLLPQYPRISVVLVLVGINDLTVRLAQGTQYTPPPTVVTGPEMETKQIRRAFSRAPGRLYETTTEISQTDGTPWHRKTAIYQALKRASAAFGGAGAGGRVQDEEGRILEVWRANRRTATVIIDELPDLTSALAEYAQNLNAIIDIAQASGSRAVLMTQPVLWRENLEPDEERLLWMGGVGNFQDEAGKPYYSIHVLGNAMARYNNLLLGVCASRRIDCIDLASLVPRTVEVFYDDAHFTETGARLVARIVSEHLARSEAFLDTGEAKSPRS